MPDGVFQQHTSCISEAQKYEKTVWKGDKVKGKGKGNQQQQQQQQRGQPSATRESASTASHLSVRN